jgi:hypothetical protein
MMKRVAKRVTLSLAESKRFTILNEAIVPNIPPSVTTTWWIRNIFAPPTQSVFSSGIVGNEIQHPLLKLKFNTTIDWGTLRAIERRMYGTIRMHVFIIAMNEQLDYSIPVNYATISPSPFVFLQSNGNRPTLNGNNVKVLKHYSRSVTPDIYEDQGQGFPVGTQILKGEMSYRWKRKLTYEDTGLSLIGGAFPKSNILRGWNYYILAGVCLPGANAANTTPAVSIAMDSFLYFKDP